MPKPSTRARKVRSDSVLHKSLKPQRAQALYEKLEHGGMTYVQAQDYLLKTCGINISSSAICQWAGKRRRAKADADFARLLAEIKADKQQALDLGKEAGEAHQLNDANVLMFSQALFEAKRSNDPRAMKQAADLFSTVLEAVAKTRSADARMISAENSRNKFQFDAAKQALLHAAELQKIRRSNKGSEREKIDRAVVTLFGERPIAQGVEPALPS
jgi:hypothetical protein